MNMSWLSLGLLATGLHASIAVADKVILEKHLKSSWAYPFFTALFLGAYCLAILMVRVGTGQFQPPTTLAALLALLPGLLHYAAALVSTQALLRADASTVAAIGQASPIFSVLWGALFLGDKLSPINYVGVFILVIFAAGLAWEKPQASLPGQQSGPVHVQRSRPRLSLALWLVLLAALLRSLSDLFTKIAVTDLVFWDAFALSRLGMLIPALLLIANPVVRAGVTGPVMRSGGKVIWLVAIVEIFALVNLMTITAAYARGPLALVSATQSTVPLFILALTGMLNRLRMGTVPVKPGGLTAAARLALSAGMIGGVYLLSFQ